MKPILSSAYTNKWVLLSAFFLPLWPVAAMIMWGLTALTRLLDKDDRRTILTGFRSNKLLWGLPIFYGIHILGLIHTSNFSYAGLDLQTKLTFLLLPFVIGTLQLRGNDLRNIKIGFTIGCLLSCAIMLFYAIYQYTTTHHTNWFFYTDYSSLFMHPTYLTMYLSVAVYFVLERLLQTTNRTQGIIVGAELFFLLANSILLSARTALATTLLLTIVFAFIAIREKKFSTAARTGWIIAIGCSILFYVGMNRINNRFTQVEEAIVQQSEQATVHNSTTGRIEIWKESLVLLQDNWIIGTGTGDIKDELLKSYAEHQFTYGLERKLNSHNQFLQTWLALGIAGLLSLVALLLIPLIKTRISTDNAFLFLVGIITLNAMTESILEVQKGVFFLSFFSSLMLNRTNKSDIPN
jgi:O-antigen ligase